MGIDLSYFFIKCSSKKNLLRKVWITLCAWKAISDVNYTPVKLPPIVSTFLCFMPELYLYEVLCIDSPLND